MRIAIESFRGEVPRLTPRALPDAAAQLAINARLLSGDLEAWGQFSLIKALAGSAPVRTVFLLKDRWLSWAQQVDVARGLIPGDNTYRTYLTCPALYARPQFTTYAMATTGSEPYPVATRPLGVPAPQDPPTMTFTVESASESNIAITNAGAEVGTTSGWTVDSGALVVLNNGDVSGLNAYAGTRFFGGGSVAASEAHQDVDIEAEGVIDGQGLKLTWQQARGANSSKAAMGIEFYDDVDVLISSSFLDQIAPAALNTWTLRDMLVQVPSGAVKARLVQRYTRVGGGSIDAYIDGITLASVEYTNYFDGSSLSGWQISSNFGTVGDDDQWRSVGVDASSGWAPPCIRLAGDEAVPWIHRDFSTDQSPAVTLKVDFQIQNNFGMQVLLFATDAGRGTSVYFSTDSMQLVSNSSWDDFGTTVEKFGPGLSTDRRYTAIVVADRTGDAAARVTVTLLNSEGTVVSGFDALKSELPTDGPHIGIKLNSSSLESVLYVDNLYVTVAAPKSADNSTSTATAYLYTFVNDLGEESAPSEVSSTLLRPDGVDVTVTTPAAVPSGIDSAYGITTKRIYRAATGASGSIFRFVAEIALATATYVDALTDEQLGEALESEDWDLPPDDLEGIRALPNGIMVGFRRNQLCFSAQNRPHAWPVAYRLTTDSDIVAISNVDTTVVVGTRSFVYTASGTSPESYSMSQPGVEQACTSKVSMANLAGGAAFASPDGLMLAAGPTQVRNLTGSIFSRKQWQALNPDTMLGAVHDDVFFLFCAPDVGDPRAYAIDAKPDGFGVIELAFHATAVHTDPLTDALHLVLDDVNEPSAPYLAEASTAPTPNGHTIYQFDGHASQVMAYQWRSKLYLLPYSAAFLLCQVKADDFDNLVLRLYGDGAMFLELRVTSDEPFTLPMVDAYDTAEIEFVGTSRVRTVQLVEDVRELT